MTEAARRQGFGETARVVGIRRVERRDDGRADRASPRFSASSMLAEAAGARNVRDTPEQGAAHHYPRQAGGIAIDQAAALCSSFTRFSRCLSGQLLPTMGARRAARQADTSRPSTPTISGELPVIDQDGAISFASRTQGRGTAASGANGLQRTATSLLSSRTSWAKAQAVFSIASGKLSCGHCPSVGLGFLFRRPASREHS